MRYLLTLSLLLPMLAIAAEGDIPIEQADGNFQSQTISGDASVTGAGVISVLA